MDSVDFQRVEVDLQRQLHSDRLGNIQSNRLMLQDFPLSPTGNYRVPSVNPGKHWGEGTLCVKYLQFGMMN